MKKNCFTRMATLLLAMVLFIGTVIPNQAFAAQTESGSIPSENFSSTAAENKFSKIGKGQISDSKTNTDDDDAWKNNILTKKGLDVFGIDRDKILSVTFLDSLEDAPKVTWHIGKNASKRVQGWVEYENGFAHIFIAAEGGINPKLCCQGFFSGCEILEEINFNGAFHTEEVTSMRSMFNRCADLESLDLETLDTSNVTDMYQMFRDCVSLKELDLSGFDTSNVKNMSCMFSYCNSLVELDLSSFDTAKVTNMSYMFSACTSMEYVNTSSFNTAKVRDMTGMFRWCNMLERLDLSGWDVSRVKYYDDFMNAGTTIDGRDWEKFFD